MQATQQSRETLTKRSEPLHSVGLKVTSPPHFSLTRAN